MEGLINRLAAASDVTPAEAADQIEKLIDRILKRLRDGTPAHVPGLGKFSPGPSVQFQPERENADRKKPGRSARRGR
jgi:nucleoid DNA-binding protein